MSHSDLISSPIGRYLTHFRMYYPGILEWCSRLKDGFATGQRKMFVSWSGSDISGLAITKNGCRAKLCHISVSPLARDIGIGSTIAYMALSDMVNHGAKEIKVTTGEDVYRYHAHFFRAFGFRTVDWKVHKYRHGVSEILWKLEVNPESPHIKNIVSHPLQHCIEIFGSPAKGLSSFK